jgi:hypothetical protein
MIIDAKNVPEYLKDAPEKRNLHLRSCDMKLKLETIIIFVQNVDRLKSFYVDILGLDLLKK